MGSLGGGTDRGGVGRGGAARRGGGVFGAADGSGVRILEPERTVLRANVTVLPDDPQDLGGQTRRILARLTVTVTRREPSVAGDPSNML